MAEPVRCPGSRCRGAPAAFQYVGVLPRDFLAGTHRGAPAKRVGSRVVRRSPGWMVAGAGPQ